MQLVVLVGPKASGKDTVAELLKKQKKISGNVAFALPLKRICSVAFDLGLTNFSHPILKETQFKEPVKPTIRQFRLFKEEMLKYVDPYEPGKFHNLNKIPANIFMGNNFQTPRQLLQYLGTEIIRNYVNPDWHCMAAFGAENMRLSKLTNTLAYAVTDCRFVNEYAYLKQNYPNAYFFYVERPEAEEVLVAATHASELETQQVKALLLADGGEIIKNEGSLKDLEKLVKTLEIEKREPLTPVDPNSPMNGRFKFASR